MYEVEHAFTSEKESAYSSSGGRKVVVDQHAGGRRVGLYGFGQAVEPSDLVEVHAEDDVGLGDETREGAVAVLLENADLRDIAHPLQEVGVSVRCDAAGCVAEPLEVGAPGQRRADRVAVGVRVAEQRDLAGGSPDQFAQAVQFVG